MTLITINLDDPEVQAEQTERQAWAVRRAYMQGPQAFLDHLRQQVRIPPEKFDEWFQREFG